MENIDASGVATGLMMIMAVLSRPNRSSSLSVAAAGGDIHSRGDLSKPPSASSLCLLSVSALLSPVSAGTCVCGILW